jgi:hypothetical protein
MTLCGGLGDATDDFRHLELLTNLRKLDLSQTPVPDDALRALIYLTALTTLELTECEFVTDAILIEVVGRLPRLVTLNLR